MPAGSKAIITIENEQILISAMSISGGVITCTIDTRGYGGTSAATHASGTLIELHLTKGYLDGLQNEIATENQGYIFQGSVTTIAAANQHTIAGDQTTIFTPGRVFLFQVSSVWYRGVVRSSSYSVGTTTINLTGDALPASGTVTLAGFEFFGSINKPVDYALVKEATNVPGDTPPAGYVWLFAKGKAWWLKDSSSVVRRLSIVQASASSSGGVLTLDWNLADVYDCTLTENITGVTHQNGADGEEYTLRIKQHASAAKTVGLGSGGGTRFSDSVATYAATTVLNAYDILSFRYNATDSKYDITDAKSGFTASPTGSAAPATKDEVRKNKTSGVAAETITAGDPVIIKAAVSVGPNGCGTGADDASTGSNAWSNPGNITANDGSYATAGAGQNSSNAYHYLKATNFGFSLPSNAQIQGIVVGIKRLYSVSGGNANVGDNNVRVVKSNGSIGTTDRANTSPGWSTTERTDSFGSSTDLWGESWLYSDINSANFGFVLAVQANGATNGPGGVTASVNWFTVTVYYVISGQLYRADASSTLVKGFVGIALNGGTVGTTINYSKPGGIADSLSGLQAGKFYYIGNSPGLLQQSAGTTSARVGMALSPTELLVMHDVAA
jgi:aspartate 1-decarboxylase